MSIVIFQNEASANSRTVPVRLFTSDGTSPDTAASNDSLIQITPSAATFIPNAKLAAVHAAQGMYAIVLNQSDVSLTGVNALYHTQGDFPQHVANINVVAYNPNDGARLALSNITVPPGTYSGVTFGINNIAAGAYSGVTIGGSSFVTINPGTYSSVTVSTGNIAPGTYSGVTVGINNIAAGTYSGVTVGAGDYVAKDMTSKLTVGVGNIAAGSYSGVTIAGVTRVNSSVTIADATYSAVTVGVGNITAGTYSGVTVGINNIAAGSYSGVTIAGVTRVNSSVTIADGTYSAVTIGGVTRVNSNVTPADGTYSAITIGGVTRVNSNVTIAAANYTSSVTVGVGGFNTGVITTASIAAAAFDTTVFSTDAEQAFADRTLLRSIAGGADSGRSVGQALYALRNRVDASSSIGTVYQVDDTTSAYTFSTTTADFPISSVDPA